MIQAQTNRYQFKFADAQLDDAMQMAFNGLYSTQDAILSIANQAELWATINGSGHIVAVDIISGGKYNTIPKITPVGGGGSGSVFTALLDGQTGAIRSVTFTPGAGWTSPPRLVITGGQ